MSTTVYLVRDVASGEYVAGGEYVASPDTRTPAAEQSRVFETRAEAEAACHRDSDRVVARATSPGRHHPASAKCDCGSGLLPYKRLGVHATPYCESCDPSDGSPPRTQKPAAPAPALPYGGSEDSSRRDSESHFSRLLGWDA